MIPKVLVVGSWHLGSVVGTCVADSDNEVHFWDQGAQVAAKWQDGKPPIHEPGLEEMVQKYWGKKLFWTASVSDMSRKADWIFLTYDTPINDKDEIIIDAVEEGFNEVLKSGFKNEAHFFFTSQLPVGTSRKFLSRIQEANPHWSGFVFYMPENLRLGEAIKSFKTPDRMVVGVHEEASGKREKAISLWRELIKDEKTPINVMSLESAEMVKHALNAFLANCVVFANEVSEICEHSGADAWEVMASLKQDSRVGPKAFLRPGLGFAGGTLARDVKTLSKLNPSKKKHNFFSSIYNSNQHRNQWVVDLLEKNLGSLKNKNIVLLGVTYKPFTSTVRRSPALEIGELLRSQGAKCAALDPMADLNELSVEEKKSLPFRLYEKPEQVFEGAHAAVVVTEWPQFLEFDYGKIKNQMADKLIVDTKNLFSKHSVHQNFKVLVPGK